MKVEFPLHFMRQGERGRVVGIRWREEDVEQRLVQMGFERGVEFEVIFVECQDRDIVANALPEAAREGGDWVVEVPAGIVVPSH